jgi:hypothetical protein
MMFVIKGISLDPFVGGSVGQCMSTLSARSSVAINADQLFNTRLTSPQANSTSGYYAGRFQLSSMSGQRARGFAQTRKVSRHFSLSSSHIEPKVRCVAQRLSQSTLRPAALVPHTRLCGCPDFRGTREMRVPSTFPLFGRAQLGGLFFWRGA